MSVAWPTGPYDIVLADPPWEYQGTLDSGSRATRHYMTMPLEAICDLPVKGLIARDALIYMWATGPCLTDAICALNAWGVKYRTIAFVWDKVHLTPGSYTMSQTELVLVAKRGSIPKPRGTRNERQLHTETRTVHSRKPDAIHAAIERMHPHARKLELFARRVRPGWDVWGNEV